jgi:hypothetical protein
MEFARDIYDVILDRSSEEVLGVLFGCLALSLVAAGLFALLRSRVKDPVLLVALLTMPAVLAAMAATGAYFHNAARNDGGARGRGPASASPHAPGPPNPYGALAWVFVYADEDHDGQLTREEASKAVSRWFSEVGGGPFDVRRLTANLESRLYGSIGGPQEHFADLAGFLSMAVFERLNAGRDALITPEALMSFLRTADADQNGGIDAYELADQIRALDGPKPEPGGEPENVEPSKAGEETGRSVGEAERRRP